MKQYYGIVEGFFSTPLPTWTPLERRRTIEQLIHYTPEINTYFYCPKNDPYVTDRWARLYPKKTLRELEQLVKLCERNGIEFCYGFNPEFDLAFVQNNLETYLAQITKKIRQLQSIGIKTFCILYDDIPYAYDVTEQAKSQQDRLVASLHATVMNRLRMILNETINDLWFCSPDYFLCQKTPYIQTLNKQLDPAIAVFWTGDRIFTKNITNQLMKRMRLVMGMRRVLWWNNYPVNDCEHPVGTFHIGAFQKPDQTAIKNLNGILINPMREAVANRLVYDTFHQFLQNPQSYQRDAALQKAFKRLFGDASGVWQRIYVSFSHLNVVDDSLRGYQAEMMNARTVTDLRRCLRRIEKDLDALKTRHLSSEARQFFKATRSVIERATTVSQFLSEVIQQRSWQQSFCRLDELPVVLKKTYLTKLFRVVLLRVAFTQSIIVDSRLLEKTMKLLVLNTPKALDQLEQLYQFHNSANAIQAFVALYKRYLGMSRLHISAADEKYLFALIKKLTQTDQEDFLEAMKDKGIIDIVRLAIQRWAINGYFLKG